MNTHGLVTFVLLGQKSSGLVWMFLKHGITDHYQKFYTSDWNSWSKTSFTWNNIIPNQFFSYFSNYTHNCQYFNFAEQFQFIWNTSSKIHFVHVCVYLMVLLTSILPWVRRSTVVREGGLRPQYKQVLGRVIQHVVKDHKGQLAVIHLHALTLVTCNKGKKKMLFFDWSKLTYGKLIIPQREKHFFFFFALWHSLNCISLNNYFLN